MFACVDIVSCCVVLSCRTSMLYFDSRHRGALARQQHVTEICLWCCSATIDEESSTSLCVHCAFWWPSPRCVSRAKGQRWNSTSICCFVLSLADLGVCFLHFNDCRVVCLWFYSVFHKSMICVYCCERMHMLHIFGRFSNPIFRA